VYRLDRTAFRIASFAEADNNCRYWLTKPVEERLRAANFLTRQAYNIAQDAVLRMDRGQSGEDVASDVWLGDFSRLLAAFESCTVDYLLVGDYAVIIHGYSRPADKLSLWVKDTGENYRRLSRAFTRFGMPPDHSFGVPPVAVDLITKLKGLEFAEAHANSSVYTYDELSVRVVQYGDLLAAKRAAGRLRDLNDVEQLEKGRR
jgi:hypothetical protein